MTIVTDPMEIQPGTPAENGIDVAEESPCVLALEGADVTLSVQLPANGSAAPTSICWYRGDQEVVGERFGVSENNNTVHLSLQQVTRADVGHYTLVAKNMAGEVRRTVELRLEDRGDIGGPDAPAFLRRLSDLAVKVGTRTRFLVEIRSSSDVKVTWHRSDVKVVEGERFRFLHEGNFFCVDVAPVMTEDGGRWTCMAENEGGRSSCSSHLNVLVPKAYKVPEFLEELQALLTESGTVSLECKVIGVPTPVLRWYKDGKEIKAGDVFALTANPDDPTSLGTYTCEAANCMGKTYSSSRVHVVGKGSREGSLKPADSLTPTGPPPIFTQELGSKKVKIGEPFTLSCQVGVPPWPKSIAWYNREGRVEESDKYHVMEDGLGGYMVETLAADAEDDGEWKCVATNFDGSMGFTQATVAMQFPKNYRKPRFLESLKAILTEEGLVSFECKVVGFPTPQLRWFKDGQELKPGDVYQLTGTNSLGSYSCIAKNVMGEATSSAELTVEDIQSQLNEEERLQLFSTNQPPKFVHGLKSCEAKINEDYRLTVQVSISPEPQIAWYRDDENLEDSDRYHVTRENLGTCHVDIKRLEIIDQAEWKCVATNDFGHSVTSCFLKLSIPKHFKRPRFLENLRAILSEEGAVNLECKVIGVPQPVLKWYKDGEELKPGDIHRIISGEDGTCCLGTYTCEAHNCMGTVASSASLLGFEDRMLGKGAESPPIDQGVGLASLAKMSGHMIARDPSLSTIHEERTSQMYDPATERSLTVDERGEVSFSFDGKEVSVSLYETPDLTEEEALQVVEMYADELSEHVSEHNVVELPPLRFVKQTSTTGKLLREALVIDVTPDYFASAEEDLRTDADVEDLSISEAGQHPGLPQDYDDDGAFDELEADGFLDRALASNVPYPDQLVPQRPPRKKTTSRGESDAKDSDGSFHSMSAGKGVSVGKSTKQDDKNGQFADGIPRTPEGESNSKIESFGSARGSVNSNRPEEVAQVVPVENRPLSRVDSNKRKSPEPDDNSEGRRNKHSEPKLDHSTQTGPPKKVMRSVESSQGQSFENITRNKSDLTAAKATLGSDRSQIKEETQEAVNTAMEVDPGKVVTGGDVIPQAKKHEIKLLKKQGSGESKEVVPVVSKKSDEETTPKVSRKKIKRSSSKEKSIDREESAVATEPTAQKEEQSPVVLRRKKNALSVSRSQSKEGDQMLDPSKSEKIAEASPSAARKKRSTDKKEVIQKQITSKDDSYSEEGDGLKTLLTIQRDEEITVGDNQSSSKRRKHRDSRRSSSFESNKEVEEEPLGTTLQSEIENITQQMTDREKRLSGLEFELPRLQSPELVETVETSVVEKSEPSLIDNLTKSLQCIQKGLASVEEQVKSQLVSQSLKSSLSVLESLSQPISDIQKGISMAEEKSSSEELTPGKSGLCLLESLSQPIKAFQRGLAKIEQQAFESRAVETPLERTKFSILENVAQPVEEFHRGIALIQQQAMLEAGEESLADVSNLPNEYQKALGQIEQMNDITEESLAETPSLKSYATAPQDSPVWKNVYAQIGQSGIDSEEASLADAQSIGGYVSPVAELQRALTQISKGVSLTDRKDSTPSAWSYSTPPQEFGKPVSQTGQKFYESESLFQMTNVPVLQAVVQPVQELQRAFNALEQQTRMDAKSGNTTQSCDPILESLSQTIDELRRGITIVEQHAEMEQGEEGVSSTVLSIVTEPMQELERNIALIEQQQLVGSGAALITGSMKLGMLKDLEYPIRQLVQGLSKVQNEYLFGPEEVLQTKLPMLENIEQSIKEVQKGIEIVTKSDVSTESMDASAWKGSQVLSSLAQPLIELQRGIIQVQRNVILETNAQSRTDITSTSLDRLSQPLHELESGLARVEKFVIEETAGQSASSKTLEVLSEPLYELKSTVSSIRDKILFGGEMENLDILAMLGQPLQSLQHSLGDVVRQQKPLPSQQSSLQVVQGMAQSVDDLKLEVARIEYRAVSEPPTESLKATLSVLGKLAEPLQELHQGLINAEQSLHEPNEISFSEISDVSALQTLSKPLKGLRAGLAQIEKIVFENVTPLEEFEHMSSRDILTPVIHELQEGIADIHKQTIWEFENESNSERPASSLLETLYRPLQELQRSLSTIIEEPHLSNELESPKIVQSSANVFESMTQSIQDLRREISMVEAQPIVALQQCHPIQENAISMLGTLAEPLFELQVGISQLEQQVLGSQEASQMESESVKHLAMIVQPIKELTKHITCMQSSATEMSNAEKFNTQTPVGLDSLIGPIQELHKGIEQFTIHAATETATKLPQFSLVNTLARSLNEINKNLSSIENVVAHTPNILVKQEATHSEEYQQISQSLTKMQQGSAMIKKQELLETNPKFGVLKNLLEPIEALALNWEELQVSTASLHSEGNIKPMLEMAKPVEELQRNIAVAKEQLIMQSGNNNNILLMLDTISQPINEIKATLSIIEEDVVRQNIESLNTETNQLGKMGGLKKQPVVKVGKPSVSKEQHSLVQPQEKIIHKATFGVAEKLNESLLELQDKLSLVARENLLAVGIEQMPEAKVQLLENLQQPLEQLQRGISLIEEKKSNQSKKQLLASKIGLIDTLSQPVEDLHQLLFQIEQARAVEISEKPVAEQTGFSVLEYLTQPIKTLQLGLYEMQQQIQLEHQAEQTSEELLLLKSVEQPLKEIHGILTEFKKHENAMETGHVAQMPIQNIQQPIETLKQGLMHIKQELASKASIASISVESATSLQQALLLPIEELEAGLNVITQQDLSKHPDLSIKHALTQPLQDLEVCLANIEEQRIVFEGEEEIPKNSGFALLKTLTSTVRELESDLYQVEEQLEESPQVSLLKAMIQPVTNLQHGLCQIEQIVLHGSKENVNNLGESVLEYVSNPIAEMQLELAKIEKQIVVGETSHTLESVGLKSISKPIEALRHGLAAIENTVLQKVDGDLSDKSDWSVLKTLATPLEELQQGLAEIEQQFILEGPEEEISEMSGLSLLKTIAHPMQEIQHSIAQIEQQFILEGRNDFSFEKMDVTQAVLQQEGGRNLAQIQEQAIYEAKGIDVAENTTLALLRTITQPMQEIQKSVAQIEQHFILEGRGDDMSEKSDLSVLKTIAHPLEELQKGLAQIEFQVAMERREEDLSEKSGMSFLKTIAQPIQEIQQCVAQIEQQFILEGRGDDVSDKSDLSALKTLAQPLEELQRGLAQIEFQVAMERKEEDLSDKSGFSMLKTIAHPMKELQRAILQIEQQVVLDAREEQMSDKSDMSVLKRLAHSVEEPGRALAGIEQQLLLDTREEDMSDKTELSAIKTVARTLQQEQLGLAQTEQQIVLDPREQDMSEKSDLSLLKTLANPLEELQRSLAQIEQQVTLDVVDDDISLRSEMSMLKTIAHPIEELQRGLAQIHQQMVLEPRDEDMSDKSDYSLLKTLAHPLEELHHGLAQIEQQVVLEAKGKDIPENTELLLLRTIAKPVEELWRGIAQIEEQLVLDGRGLDMSEKSDLAVLKSMAVTLQELNRSFAQTQQQVVFEAQGESISEKPSISRLVTLAGEIAESQRGIALTHEQMVFEPGTDDKSLSNISELKTLANPLQEIMKSLAVVQQQYVLEFSGALSDKEDVSALKTLAVSIQDLHIGLIQIGEQIVMEGGKEFSRKDNASLLATLAQPIREVQNGIALISQQHVMDTGVLTMSENLDITALKTLAKPLKELEQKIGVIEEQQLLEAFVEPMSEDETIQSDLPTLRSTPSLSLGVANIQEQLPLDGDLESFSDNTDNQALEQLSLSSERSKRGVAIVQQPEIIESQAQSRKELKENEEENKKKENDERELKEKEREKEKMKLEELELKKREAEKTKEKELELKRKEEEKMKKEHDELDLKKKDDEKNKNEKEELELKKEVEKKEKECEELELKKKEKEAFELKKEEEENKKKEQEELQLKKAEDEERKNKKEEIELQKKAEETQKKKQKELELKKREDEEKKREKEQLELKKKEEEKKKKEQEELELKKQEDENKKKEKHDLELKTQEEEKKKKDKEELELKKKEDEKKKKEKEELELKKKEEDKKNKEKEELELKEKEEERKKKDQEELELKKKEEEKKKKEKEKDELELKKKEKANKEKEQEELELKKKENEKKKKEKELLELKKKEEETKKKEDEKKKKEKDELEVKKKEEDDKKNKEKEQLEAKKKEEEKAKKEKVELELKKKEEENKVKEQQELELKKKEEEELQAKKKEEEKQKKEKDELEMKKKKVEKEKKEKEEVELKKKEEEKKVKEQQELELKKKEDEKKKKEKEELELKVEEERKKKEQEELELKKKDDEKKKKEKEELELKKKEEERKKKEQEELELKKKDDEKKRKEKEELELNKKEEEKKKKEQKELELKKKEVEKKKEQEELEIKKKEEKKKKEQEELELKKKEEEKKKKEQEELELKKKEEEKKKKEQEELELKKKEEEKKKKEQEELELKKKEEEKKKKEQEELELKKKEEEKKKKEQEELELKKKEEEELQAKKKEEEKHKKEKDELEMKKKKAEKEKKEKEEVELKSKEEENKVKEQQELELKKKEDEKKKKEKEELELKVEEERKKKEQEELELKKKDDEKKRKEKEELELKKKEEEKKKKEQEELELKKKEIEKKKEQEELELKKKEEEKKKKEQKELELKKEEEKKKKKQEELELKKKEDEKKRKEKEELELKKNEEERKKKEQEELELKKKEDEKKRKEKEELELKKKEEEKKKKEQEKLELKKKEIEKKKEQEELELKKKEEEKMKKEQEELELKKKEEEKKKKEQKELELKKEEEKKKKEQEELELKKKEDEKKRKEKEELELKKKEEERKKKEQEELDFKKKEDEKKKKEKEELELKKKEDEKKKKEKEELELKKKEEEKKKQEQEELELKKKEVEKKKEKEELERKKKEEEKKKKEQEELELKKKEEEKKKKEQEELELKKKEDEKKIKEKEEVELKKKEEEKMKQEQEQLELKKKEVEKKKEKEELELKKKEDEMKKKEKEELELKKKEDEKKRKEKEELELKKKEEETKRKEQEELELKKKEEEKKRKEQEDLELKKKEDEKLKKKKEKEELELKNKEEETKKKKQAELELQKKEEENKKKEIEEAELKKNEEVIKKKLQEELELKKKEKVDRKKKEESNTEEVKESGRKGSLTKKKLGDAKEKVNVEVGQTAKDDESKKKVLDSVERAETTKIELEDKKPSELTSDGSRPPPGDGRTQRRRSRPSVGDTADSEGRLRPRQADDGEDDTRRRRRQQQEEADSSEVQWSANRVTTRSRSFTHRSWAEDACDNSETLTATTLSSTLTPRQRGRSRPDDSSIASTEDISRDISPRRSRTRDRTEPYSRDADKKPTFCTRLTDRTAAQGSRIKLMCSVLGSPDPAVEWLRDGLPLLTRPGDSAKFRQCLEDGLAQLEVVNASTADSAEYTCVARNVHGETSSTATLKVFADFEPAPCPPVFTRGIKDVYHFSDDELVLECRVRSQPPPRVTWFKDNVALRPSSRYQQTDLRDGLCRLVINGPETATDSGMYSCRAENMVWSDQISHLVQFAGRESQMRHTRAPRDVRRPHFSSVLTDHMVPTGGTIALQVEIKGASKPDVTWMRGSEPLPRTSTRVRTFEEAGVYTLMVADARETEAGIYTCRATNLHGYVDTSAAVEVVRPSNVRGGRPAMFMSRPDQDMSVALGEDITVSFRVQGDPKPRVIWMKGTRDITNSQRSLKESIDDYVRLTLKRALPSDAGTYCILAKNMYGCDRSFVTVQIRRRARSLTPSVASFPQETSNILRDVHDEVERTRRKDVPGPVGGEPGVVESGRNWLTLAWPKAEQRGGVPVIAYRVEGWKVGDDGGARWAEMGVTPINSYDAFNLKPGSEYLFRVTPRNRYGWGESVTTRSSVVVGKTVELPEFVQILPGQLKALQGSNIRLECQVKGDPTPEVRWYRDGTELDPTCPRFSTDFNGSQCRLSVDELRDEDSGRYMCEATNKRGRVSTFARLLVVSDPKIWEADTKLKRGIQDEGSTADVPPQFTMRLRDRRVQMTYPVRLTCQVVGRPMPQVTWSRDGQELKQDSTHTFWHEEHFHTLELSHASLEDSGCYSATAKNPHGAVSCRCHLVVDKGIRAYVAPDFLSNLEAVVNVREGGELRLSAQVEAYPTVGVMWHRDGVRLRPSRHAIMTLDHDGGVELALAGATLRDAGVYTCTATNEVGRAETVSRVTVVATSSSKSSAKVPQVIGPEIPYSEAPLWVTKPRSTEAQEGDTVIITCEVVGDPKPEVMWLRDWLKPDYYRDAPHFRRLGEGPQYRLEIPRAKLDFTGAYSVIARNIHGEAKAVISLQIYAKGQWNEKTEPSSIKHGKVQTLPVITRELKDLRCCDGDAVTLECGVHATPTPDVRWEKEGRLLPLGGDFQADFDGSTALLSIHQVYPEDEGEYSCVVYNELGRSTTSACLVVDVPEEKETLLSRQLTRPPGLLSGASTPRSTPRTTPSRSKSPSVSRFREREPTPSSSIGGRIRRLKVTSPKFYAIPHNRIAEEGETIRFQCAIAGHPTPWVTWDKDGLLVTPSARLTITEHDDLRVLELSEVTVEDAGLYRITLENEVGRIEASARLEVIGRHGSRANGVRAWSSSPRSSPTFGRRLIGSAARVGSRLTLDCDIRGTPSPVPSWYRNGELVVMSSRVTPTWDGKTARLEVSPVEEDDAGVYCCVAENEAGTSQCNARVVVLARDDPSQEDRQPPVFLRELHDLSTHEGHGVELQAQLHGSAPIEVVWSKNDVEIPDCADFRYVSHDDGRVSLRIADAFPEDAGVYRCEAFNKFGDAVTCGNLTVTDSVTDSITDSVPEELHFTKKPNPVIVAPGRDASFCARLAQNSLHTAQIRWTVAGRDVEADSRYQTEEDGDVFMLHIAAATPSDAGTVTCTATSRVTLASTSCTTELSVADEGLETVAPQGMPATLIIGPSDTTVLRGDRVVLKATFTGYPTPHVRWLRAGRELTSGGRVEILDEDEGVSSLTIDGVTADEGGKYVVSVENCFGADCHFASVAVEGPPDPPACQPNVSELDAPLSCVVAWSSSPYDGGCIVTSYSVEMRRGAAPDWTVLTDDCHSFSHVVPGLVPGESYVFRVRAFNVHGASEPSAESHPFVLGQHQEDEETFTQSFEPRIVAVESGADFKQRFDILEELGKGRFGVVHKVCDQETGEKLAAKFIRCIKSKDREKVQEEIDIMNCLRHPKLLQLAAAFENPREIIMVMELISGGELFERVVADDFTLTEKDCILFMRQIVEGVEYMHHNSVVHLDLKPENIMCYTRTSHQIKLIDFGLAKKLDPSTPVRVLFGTPEFIPPEIINYEIIGLESDMWSVGVICYVLLSGLSPFMGDSDAETFANITRADFDFDDEAFDAISQEAKEFISSLLVQKKEKRLTASQCLQCTWLAQQNESMSCVKLSTDKLKKFIIRRKWQKTGNAIRALGRMATLSASRRNSNAVSVSTSPRPSVTGFAHLASVSEDNNSVVCVATNPECNNQITMPENGFLKEGVLSAATRSRFCSERSDSGISDCSSASSTIPLTHLSHSNKHLLNKKFSISEEVEFNNDETKGVDDLINGRNDSKRVHGCSSPSANSYSKTGSLRQQGSVDSGIGDVKTGHPSARGGQKTPRSIMKPTVASSQKTVGLPKEHSTNYKKAMAFWKP